MTALKIIGITLLVLFVAGFAVLNFCDVGKLIDKARTRRAEKAVKNGK